MYQSIRRLLAAYKVLLLNKKPENVELGEEMLCEELDAKVEIVENELKECRACTATIRRENGILAFFSAAKAMCLYRELRKENVNFETITMEIAFLFEPDEMITKQLLPAVKSVVTKRWISQHSSSPPLQIICTFISDVRRTKQQPKLMMEGNEMDFDTIRRRSIQFEPFCVHAAHSFTPLEIVRLIYSRFNGFPKWFQVLRCSEQTKLDELELFLSRVLHWSQYLYLVLGVNMLSHELQEFLIEKCSQKPIRLEFVEYEPSILRQVPWVFVKEYTDLTNLCKVEDLKQCLIRYHKCLNTFSSFQLVYGCAGNGKTHYIKHQLKSKFSTTAQVVVALNETFDAQTVIKKLQGLGLKRTGIPIYINFTFTFPEDSENEREKNQYRKLVYDIGWFFFDLFVMNYYEDADSGISFSLPCQNKWSVYVEVPVVSGQIEESQVFFQQNYPSFFLLGEWYCIETERFHIDDDVQLVCKYLKAYLEDDLDRMHEEGRKPIQIGDDNTISERNCQGLLCHSQLVPEHARQSKLLHNLFIRYMVRRCKFLESSPALQYNVGIGEMIKDQHGNPTDKYTNTKKLRSMLFHQMLDEVAAFCRTKMVKYLETQQQLIYDFVDGGMSFGLLTVNPHEIPGAELEKFEELGITVPSVTRLNDREVLDSYLSRALGIPLKNGHITAIDEQKYVLTLDYVVKMLNIHERCMCGIPVVVTGETGVGKTFLVEMLSHLWNQAIISQLEKARSQLLERIKKYLVQHESTENCQHLLGMVVDGKELSLEDISLTLSLKDKESSKNLYEVFRKYILDHGLTPLFHIMSAPESNGDFNFNQSFEELMNPPKNLNMNNAVASFIYSILYGKPMSTFYKIRVHSALRAQDIHAKFMKIRERALSLKASYHKCKRNDTTWKLFQFQQPIITVFLDEINTSSCLGVLKEIVIDRMMDGEDIPDNIFIIATINPYRANSLASLQNEQDVSVSTSRWTTGSYFVRPLHPTLDILSWDYGALERAQEEHYISAKISLVEPDLDDIDRSTLNEFILTSQQLLRDYACEHLQLEHNFSLEEAKMRSKSTVSQRDIQRVFIFYEWLKRFILQQEKYEIKIVQYRALCLAIALVYYFRLSLTYRSRYVKKINMVVTRAFAAVPQSINFLQILKEELKNMASYVDHSGRIARTDAFKENIFAIIVCSMTRIPLIIVGPPGSSKTLSFKIAVDSLQGQSSANEIFRKDLFHALEPVIYQCSRHSTSKEIEAVFQHASKCQTRFDKIKEVLNMYSLVMMDEAGLPEESHESLKALHYYLDERTVSFLAISNHVLDAAKTNRAVCLFCPKSGEKDVKKLAKSAVNEKDDLHSRVVGITDQLIGCSKLYLKLMEDKSFSMRFGLRDFIYFCTYLHQQRLANNIITPQTIVDALERNFNSGENFDHICDLFLEEVGSTKEQIQRHTILEILWRCLKERPTQLDIDSEVRYKLLIDCSLDESLVRFLFSFGVLSRDTTRTYVGAHFPGDTDSQKINMIAAIRHSAAAGHCILLSQAEEIHEHFYDMFNQRFTCVPDTHGRKNYYANVAVGAHVKPSRVDPSFQCVVVIKESLVKSTPAPFLNRFEKYTLSHKVLLQNLICTYPVLLRQVILNVRDKVSSFMTLCGPLSLYGEQQETFDSLLLSFLSCPIHAEPTSVEGIETASNNKELALLSYLQTALRERCSFVFFEHSPTDSKKTAEYLFAIVCQNQIYRNVFSSLEMEELSAIVTDTFGVLMQSVDQSDNQELSDESSLVIAILQQWMVTYLCQKLMQLMTPEALLCNIKKIPSHYVDRYFNSQTHFNLESLIHSYRKLRTKLPKSSPSKILCFTRTSALYVADSTSSILDEMQHSIMSMLTLKLVASTTTDHVNKQLKDFLDTAELDIMLLVANMQGYTINNINYLRILIEEAENRCANDQNKLFVVLLHFPPEMFTQHCYPSYFLSGWDHYYLDSVAPTCGKRMVSIEKWFNYCCLKPGDSNVAISADFLKDSLLRVVEQYAPYVCAELQNLQSEEVILKILQNQKFTSVFVSKFCSYWTQEMMIELSEQAAEFTHSYKSTLSVTDAINSIVKSSFSDFLIHILLVMQIEGCMQIINSEDGSKFESLCLKFIELYPVPYSFDDLCKNIKHGINFLKQTAIETRNKQTTFPFFDTIYCCVERVVLFAKTEVKEDAYSTSNVNESITTMMLTLKQNFCSRMGRLALEAIRVHPQKLQDRFIDLSQIFDEMVKAELLANDHSLWNKYFKQFMLNKLDLDLRPGAVSTAAVTQSLEQLLLCSLNERIVELHSYFHVYHEYSPLLCTVLKVMDNIQHEHQELVQNAMAEQLHTIFGSLADLTEKIIHIFYGALHEILVSSVLQDAQRKLKLLYSNFEKIEHNLLQLCEQSKEEMNNKQWPEGEFYIKMKTVIAIFTCMSMKDNKKYCKFVNKIFLGVNSRIESSDVQTFYLNESILGLILEQCIGLNPTSPSLSAIQDTDIWYFVQRMFNNFFSKSTAGSYSPQDLQWLFRVANHNSILKFLRFRKFQDDMYTRFIKHYLSQVLECCHSPECMNEPSIQANLFAPWKLFNATVRQELCGFLSKHCTLGQYLPDYYLPPKGGQTCVTPLMHLYFNICFQTFKFQNLTLKDCVKFFKQYDEKLSSSQSIEEVVLSIERQAMIQLIIETLANLICLPGNEGKHEIRAVLKDVNKILGEQSTGGKEHGRMLVFRMFQSCNSGRTLMNLMFINFNYLCRDFSCLSHIHEELKSQIKPVKVKSKESKVMEMPTTFPWDIVNCSAEEKNLFHRVQQSLEVVDVDKDGLIKLAADCYVSGAVFASGVLKKHSFNMMLWLCIYYYYFHMKNKASESLVQILQTEMAQYIPTTYLPFFVCFADTSHIQRRATDDDDSLYDMFFLRESTNLDLQDLLANLVAVILGSPPNSNHLWMHLISPDLEEAFKSSSKAVTLMGSSQLHEPYPTQACFTEQKIFGNLSHKDGTRQLLGLQCQHFTAWANYGAICMNLLTNPDHNKSAGKLFPASPSVRQHCAFCTRQAWSFMSNNMNISSEDVVCFTNRCLQKIREISLSPMPMAWKSEMSPSELSTFNQRWREEIFLTSWHAVQEQESKSFIHIRPGKCVHLAIRDIKNKCPVFASPTSFLMQILSSSELNTPTSKLYLLYQFLFRRPILNAGAKLLPKLVEFYLWILGQFSFILPKEDAQNTIKHVLDTFLQRSKYPECFIEQKQMEFKQLKGDIAHYHKHAADLLLLENNTLFTEAIGESGILCKTIDRIVSEYNTFLADAKHFLLKNKISMRACNASFSEQQIPLKEATVSLCSFGTSTSFYDVQDLMSLITKCCYTTAIFKHHNPDPTLLTGCVPQVYALDELQDDIAEIYLFKRKKLCEIHTLYEEFHFKGHCAIQHLSKTMMASSVFSIEVFDLPEEAKGELQRQDIHLVEYVCHSLKYEDLAHIIAFLKSITSHFMMKIKHTPLGGRTDLYNKTVSAFLDDVNSTTVAGLSMIGIDTQQKDIISVLELRNVYGTLRLLISWMETGVYDFCSYPLQLKAHLKKEDEDKIEHLDISDKYKGLSTKLLEDLQELNLKLSQFDCKIKNSQLEQPILDILGEGSDLMKMLGNSVQVKHYVHLQCALRRLTIKVQAQNPTPKDCQKWKDGCAEFVLPKELQVQSSDDIDEDVWEEPRVMHYPVEQSYGFDLGKDLEKEFESSLEEADQLRKYESTDDLDSVSQLTTLQESTPTTSTLAVVKPVVSCYAGNTGLSSELSVIHIPDRDFLMNQAMKYWKDKEKLAEFLERIKMPSKCAKNVRDLKLNGYALVKTNDKVLCQLGMQSALSRLRFKVLFERELTGEVSELAQRCSVEKVIDFCRMNPLLDDDKIAEAIRENEVDGEMLLRADEYVLEELGIPALGQAVIDSNLIEFVDLK